MSTAIQTVKETPLLFQPDMVRATLEDRKNQTRRTRGLEKINADKGAWRYDGVNINGDHLFFNVHAAISGHDPQDCALIIKCPYGKAGDLLWGRETWRVVEREPDMVDGILYAADKTFIPIENTPEAAGRWVIANNNGKHGDHWRPSIFLPRWASRITLEITDVRVERLQDITQEDIAAEGFRAYTPEASPQLHGIAREQFAEGWNKINAKRGYSWDSNPWVWVISFKRIESR
jgi:hypothetical protein